MTGCALIITEGQNTLAASNTVYSKTRWIDLSVNVNSRSKNIAGGQTTVESTVAIEMSIITKCACIDSGAML